ncbi:MAG: FmdB family zinc ribbon protein [Bacillota bacterium]
MPIYDYKCEGCGKFQVTQGIKEKPLDECPQCKKPVHRLIGKNVNIILKGTGFYSTDTKTAVPAAESQDTKAS